MPTGIDAPAEVPEGSTGPVEISSGATDVVLVQDSRTGKETRVPLGPDGKGQFELPGGAMDGDIFLLSDPCDPTISTIITITAATTP